MRKSDIQLKTIKSTKYGLRIVLIFFHSRNDTAENINEVLFADVLMCRVHLHNGFQNSAIRVNDGQTPQKISRENSNELE